MIQRSFRALSFSIIVLSLAENSLAQAYSIQMLDKVPLLLETGHFSRELGAGKSIYILDDTVRLSYVSPGTKLEADILHYFDKPLPFKTAVEYCMVQNGDSSSWQTIASKPGLQFLAKLKIPSGNRVQLLFREPGSGIIFQTSIIEHPALVPTLLTCFQGSMGLSDSLYADRDAYIAALLASKKPAIKAGKRLELLPGMATDFLFKNPALNNDSCLQYRLTELDEEAKAEWITTGVLLALPPLKGNAIYLLEVKYVHSSAMLEYFLVSKPYWYQQKAVRFTAWLLFIGLLVTAGYFYSRYHIRKARLQRDKFQMKLQLVQNQLNPHFIYNSLGSILGLISAGENARATEYLQVFSNMMKRTMEVANEPAVSLAEELDQMILYLRIEQMRFQFRYEVHVDPQIDLSAIELPPQLLQPVIENAVRHGAAGLGSKGVIQLHIFAEGSDLCIRISNNAGPGKQVKEPGNGRGIKYTDEQIQNLQQLYKGQRISFKLTILDHKAEANFFFQNWLNPAHL
jgi:hypothetical protein